MEDGGDLRNRRPRTLGIMLAIALIGVPLVLTYSASVYWTFRHRVEIGQHSY
jgi:cytochrome d ubiquinol oxidase subunit II